MEEKMVSSDMTGPVARSGHDAAGVKFAQRFRPAQQPVACKKSENQRLATRPQCGVNKFFTELQYLHKREVAIDGLSAHSDFKSASPVCRSAVAGRVVFSTSPPALEKGVSYEFDDQRSPS
jgi:hypothetical protein